MISLGPLVPHILRIACALPMQNNSVTSSLCLLRLSFGLMHMQAQGGLETRHLLASFFSDADLAPPGTVR